MSPPRFHGLGYGNARSFEALLAEIMRRHITTVVDVREAPFSPGRPFFSGAALRVALASHSVLYVHEPRLGNGFRRDRDGLVLFREWLRSSGCASSFDARRACVELRAHTGDVGLLCGCRDQSKCHRRVILEWLAEHGAEVVP